MRYMYLPTTSRIYERTHDNRMFNKMNHYEAIMRQDRWREMVANDERETLRSLGYRTQYPLGRKQHPPNDTRNAPNLAQNKEKFGWSC